MTAFVNRDAGGLLIVLSGPSGVGKNTIIRGLLAEDPNFVHSISLTTRAPRGGEKDGVAYYFTTRDHFRELLDQGAVLEFDEYCGSYYGTPREPVYRLSGEGRDVLFDLTVSGAVQLKRKCPEAITVFIAPPSVDALAERLSARGTETPDVLARRIAAAREELRMIDHFDYCVENTKLSDAVAEIRAIIKAEKLRVSRLCIDVRPPETV